MSYVVSFIDVSTSQEITTYIYPMNGSHTGKTIRNTKASENERNSITALYTSTRFHINFAEVKMFDLLKVKTTTFKVVYLR